jgi:hypothetical protein
MLIKVQTKVYCAVSVSTGILDSLKRMETTFKNEAIFLNKGICHDGDCNDLCNVGNIDS